MIKFLIYNGEMDAAEIKGDFTEDEKRSINRMVDMINNAISEEDEEDEEDEGDGGDE